MPLSPEEQKAKKVALAKLGPVPGQSYADTTRLSAWVQEHNAIQARYPEDAREKSEHEKSFDTIMARLRYITALLLDETGDPRNLASFRGMLALGERHSRPERQQALLAPTFTATQQLRSYIPALSIDENNAWGVYVPWIVFGEGFFGFIPRPALKLIWEQPKPIFNWSGNTDLVPDSVLPHNLVLLSATEVKIRHSAVYFSDVQTALLGNVEEEPTSPDSSSPQKDRKKVQGARFKLAREKLTKKMCSAAFWDALAEKYTGDSAKKGVIDRLKAHWISEDADTTSPDDDDDDEAYDAEVLSTLALHTSAGLLKRAEHLTQLRTFLTAFSAHATESMNATDLLKHYLPKMRAAKKEFLHAVGRENAYEKNMTDEAFSNVFMAGYQETIYDNLKGYIQTEEEQLAKAMQARIRFFNDAAEKDAATKEAATKEAGPSDGFAFVINDIAIETASALNQAGIDITDNSVGLGENQMAFLIGMPWGDLDQAVVNEFQAHVERISSQLRADRNNSTSADWGLMSLGFTKRVPNPFVAPDSGGIPVAQAPSLTESTVRKATPSVNLDAPPPISNPVFTITPPTPTTPADGSESAVAAGVTVASTSAEKPVTETELSEGELERLFAVTTDSDAPAPKTSTAETEEAAEKMRAAAAKAEKATADAEAARKKREKEKEAKFEKEKDMHNEIKDALDGYLKQRHSYINPVMLGIRGEKVKLVQDAQNTYVKVAEESNSHKFMTKDTMKACLQFLYEDNKDSEANNWAPSMFQPAKKNLLGEKIEKLIDSYEKRFGKEGNGLKDKWDAELKKAAEPTTGDMITGAVGVAVAGALVANAASNACCPSPWRLLRRCFGR
ncbi:MAG: hypothetical protein DHS20C10_13980 [marine bacterium B5-7]|nr:MAG: hypothetical protein NMNS01_28070 [Nitrosomonas sp.]GJM07664.1 MAG: hypothetical protein DHS20C10_13980 [marine bacterium B5-7]